MDFRMQSARSLPIARTMATHQPMGPNLLYHVAWHEREREGKGIAHYIEAFLKQRVMTLTQSYGQAVSAYA
jgi:hypothetical protein